MNLTPSEILPAPEDVLKRINVELNAAGGKALGEQRREEALNAVSAVGRALADALEAGGRAFQACGPQRSSSRREQDSSRSGSGDRALQRREVARDEVDADPVELFQKQRLAREPAHIGRLSLSAAAVACQMLTRRAGAE